ncbi:hypothetical protein B0T22DRAFT_61726 [Podospora appendiculata]|uniref:Uncharacterized protein n=1 Tax=Podospora appendiculata TaxID=314037 RepID=A0AAE0XIL7_9PEZI|nr:hypothetical protein B0T22DRAFT_61726 [Podospora appendiculata]
MAEPKTDDDVWQGKRATGKLTLQPLLQLQLQLLLFPPHLSHTGRMDAWMDGWVFMILKWDGQVTEFSALLDGVQQLTLFIVILFGVCFFLLLSGLLLFFGRLVPRFFFYSAAFLLFCLFFGAGLVGWALVWSGIGRQPPSPHRRAIPWSRKGEIYLLLFFLTYRFPICWGGAYTHAHTRTHTRTRCSSHARTLYTV